MDKYCHPQQPCPSRVHAFFDAQNFFLTAKESFGIKFPNFDPIKLARAVTQFEPDRELTKIHFYTGVHTKEHDEFLHQFWMNKLNGLRRSGVDVFFRYLKYTRLTRITEKCSEEEFIKPREKGVDVKMAIDLIRLAQKKEYDIAIIFSQDTDFNEAIKELYEIKKELNIWLKFECAFPYNEKMSNSRGLDNTKWRKIEKDIYDLCLDETDYRPEAKESLKIF